MYPHPAADAVALDLPNLYSIRAMQDPSGRWVVLGFEQADETGEFAGRISDPVPLVPAIPDAVSWHRR